MTTDPNAASEMTPVFVVPPRGARASHQCELPRTLNGEPSPMLTVGGLPMTSKALVGAVVRCSCGQHYECEQVNPGGRWLRISARRARKLARRVS